MSSWGSGSGLWTNPAMWFGGVPDAPGANATFGNSAIGGTETAQIAEGVSIELGYLTINNLIAANTIIKGWAGDTGTGFGELVFDNGPLNAQLTVNSVAGASALLLGTDGLRMRLVSDLVVNVVNAGSVATFDIPIVDAGQLIKAGSGTLDLRGSNSFTGGINLVGGILQASGDAALGPGAITIGNDALFLSVGAVNNTLATSAGLFGPAGSAQIAAANATVLDLTGELQHLSDGTLGFGSATFAGTVLARFSAIFANPGGAHFAINGGTLAFANLFNAANLLSHPGNGVTIVGDGIGTTATLNTNGFQVQITNLQMNYGTIRALAGTLDVLVHYTNPAVEIQDRGTIIGTAGADIFTVNVDANFGMDFIEFSSWNTATDLIVLNGSAQDNSIGGSSSNDRIFGFDGNDFLGGNGGVDLIFGEIGDDDIILLDTNDGSSVHGGSGNDRLLIQNGTVTLGAISGFEGLLLLSGSTLELTGAQFASGFALTSSLQGSGTLSVVMGSTTLFNARAMSAVTSVILNITGSAANDVIKTAPGLRSLINTGNGTNIVQGSDLDDDITGGTGADKIAGNEGLDVMTGGGGADVFKFRKISDSGLGLGADQITDFLAGTDKLNFVRIDTNAALAGDQAFAYIGTAAFSGIGTAQVRWSDIGAHLLVSADLDGDGNSDMDILLLGAGTQTLTVADFVL